LGSLGFWGLVRYAKGSDRFKKKNNLKVKQSTPYVMLYGDLGCVPLSISIKKRVIGYWYDIINCDNNLSSILYRLILQDNVHNGHSYEWLKFVKTMFNDSGLIVGNSLTVLNLCFFPELKQLFTL